MNIPFEFEDQRLYAELISLGACLRVDNGRLKVAGVRLDEALRNSIARRTESLKQIVDAYDSGRMNEFSTKNGATVPLAAARGRATVNDLCYLIDSQISRTPEGMAIQFGAFSLSYSQFSDEANKVVGCLERLGVKAGDVVGVYTDRSLEMMYVLLAILRLGAAFMPLESTLPVRRVERMLQIADCRYLFLGANCEHPPAFQGESFSADDFASLKPVCNDPLPPSTNPHQLAYVLFTSGSTGDPKGCMIGHQAIVNRLLWMQDAYPLSNVDRVAQKTPISFDVSIWELFWPLISGACLVIAQPGLHRDPLALLKFIVDERISIIHFVPSMLNLFLAAGPFSNTVALRHIFSSGEALSFNLMKRCLESLPNAHLHNLYGPTEAAVDVTAWTCSLRGDLVVPIGRPISNTEIYLLDESFIPVADGSDGEIYIGGLAVGIGYVNQENLTRERFLGNPMRPGEKMFRTGDFGRLTIDGQLEYLGRKDDQVKFLGQRIELREIELAIEAIAGVSACAVLLKQTADRVQSLVAFYSLTSGTDPKLDLRSQLTRTLPQSFVPTLWKRLETFPVTTNGKLDRSKLKSFLEGDFEPRAQGKIGTEVGVAGDKIAIEIRQELARLLRAPHISATEDIFEIGGSSLTVMRLCLWINKRYGSSVPVNLILKNPTVDGIAQFVKATLSLDNSVGSLLDTEILSRGFLEGVMEAVCATLVQAKFRYYYPSAGNTYSIQTFLWTDGLHFQGVEPGLYYVHPKVRQLVKYPLPPSQLVELGRAAAGNGKQRNFAIFLVADRRAIEPLYKDASESLTDLDCGYVAEAIVAQAQRLGVSLEIRLPLRDETIDHLIEDTPHIQHLVTLVRQ
jgi:amino acid adenylation domain-containing protein